jgi:hypothetical protein
MPTTITSAGITFNDATSLTSATIPANAVGGTQIANGSVTAAKLGTTEQKQIAKAWVNFNGSTSPGTIRSSYNVSSVTKNTTGDYTVNFTTPMTDANYSIVATSTAQNAAALNTVCSGDNTVPRTVSLFRVLTQCWTSSPVNQDPIVVNVAVFGN